MLNLRTKPNANKSREPACFSLVGLILSVPLTQGNFLSLVDTGVALCLMHQCVLVQQVNPLATKVTTRMHPPVKRAIGGHGPVGLELAGQVPQNCETV